jgi:polar amino acid transport system substrate-binding protein
MKWTSTCALAAGLLIAAGVAPQRAAAADACQPDKLATKYPSLVGKKIKVGTDPETPPYTMRDPKNFDDLIGFDTELAETTFKCIGVPIEFSVGSWSGQLPAVANGQTDIMWDTLYYTPERAKQMDFVIYFTAATGGLVAKGNPKHITSLDLSSVCGIRAAAALGSVEEKEFHDISDKCVAAGKKPIEIFVAPDLTAGYRGIINDRADLYLINFGAAAQMIVENPDKLEMGFKFDSGIKVGVGVNKQERELANAIVDGLKAIRANGAEKAIYEKYKIDYSLALPIELLTK